jgi:integrase
LTVDDVSRILSQMIGTARLMAALIYGSGLRIYECTTFRAKDIDFGSRNITVRDGKGGKDHTTVLPGRFLHADTAGNSPEDQARCRSARSTKNRRYQQT